MALFAPVIAYSQDLPKVQGSIPHLLTAGSGSGRPPSIRHSRLAVPFGSDGSTVCTVAGMRCVGVRVLCHTGIRIATQQIRQSSFDRLGRSLGAKTPLHIDHSTFADPSPVRGIFECSADQVAKRLAIINRKQPSGGTMRENFDRAVGAGGDHRGARRHCLDHSQTERFSSRRQAKDVDFSEERCTVFDPTEPMYRAGNTEAVR